MEKIFDFFIDNLFIFSAAFAGGAYSVIVYIILMKKNISKKLQEDEFIKLLLEGLNSKRISDLNDVYNIFKGFFMYELENEAYRADINRILRRSIVILFKTTKENDKYTTNEIKNQINVMLNENERLSPYANLPEAERNSMKDLHAFVESGDKESAIRKAEEISNSIQLRKELVNSLERKNKWSIQLAVVGLVLTIIFGVFSLL